jgi:RNA polymerase sigma factor (sigma-70 family)
MTREMETPSTNSDPSVETPGHQSAILEMKETLSLRLPSLYRCALRLLGNAADAEDAVQEALLAAYRHIEQFRGQSQMSTWLTTIVRNCALMQLRKRHRQTHLFVDDQIKDTQPHFIWERLADGRPSPEDECRNSELTARLGRCTALLSPTLRRTFELRVMNGLSICETAQLLECHTERSRPNWREREKVLRGTSAHAPHRDRVGPSAWTDSITWLELCSR